MQAQPNTGDFYTFEELQGLKKGDLVIFAHRYRSGFTILYQPEDVWAIVWSNALVVVLANITRVQADGLSTVEYLRITRHDYSPFGRSARPPNTREYRAARQSREQSRVREIELRLERLRIALSEQMIFDDLCADREFYARFMNAIVQSIRKYKHQRRLAKRRLNYRKRQIGA